MEVLPFLLLAAFIVFLLCAGTVLGHQMAMRVSSKEICKRHNKFHREKFTEAEI
jgi:uncharacterized membrane protein